MILSTRTLFSALLLTLPLCSAAAALPAPLAGEWFVGPHYPAEVYTSDFKAASTDASRLLLGQDGHYIHTRFQATSYPSSFGTTGYPITCKMMDVSVERGTVAVQGDRITFRPTGVQLLLAMSPHTLNNGCKRHAGTPQSRQAQADSGTWQITSGKLTLKLSKGATPYQRREPAAPTPVQTGLDPALRGEWHSGRISPLEYYDTASGKWAEASGTSVRLKLHANLTYERSGLLVSTTSGCTSKLLVLEQGKVQAQGQTLTFSPTRSSATGYTCTPSKVSSSQNHIKPYSERALVRIDPRGQHTLILGSSGGETHFNRPAGTPPESPPGTQGAVTPPPPAAGGSALPGRNTPPPAVRPRWNARGEWDAVLTTPEGSIRVRFSLDDDEPRILGSGFSGSEAVGWLHGNSETGALRIGLELEGGSEVELNVSGRFEGEVYRGRFSGTNDRGEAISGGTLTMTRR